MGDDKAEMEIEILAREIAKQKSPTSVLMAATSPREIARALYLTGWRPPSEFPTPADPKGTQQ